MNAVENRLQVNIDKRAMIHAKAEELLGKDALEASDKTVLAAYREEMTALDEENTDLLAQKKADDEAAEVARLIRVTDREAGGLNEDEPAYKTMAAYARDVILTRESSGAVAQLQQQFGDKGIVESAAARLDLLKRTPANTLSSNVAGLQPPQYIDQIFQIIQTARPIVASALRSSLVRGQLTFPRVTTRPLVAVQASEKTEAGNQGMEVDMETTTASVYLGGGDLSWQAINWSSPDALQLWFDLAADNYALKTEEDAAQVIIDAGNAFVISPTFNAASGSFANLLTAIGQGAGEVWAESGRTADTVYMSMDAYWYVFGLTSTAFAQFASVADGKVGPLNFVPSRGLPTATVIVGDSKGLLVAETEGAPVDLQVVEPAIGGVEVGIIGAFEAVCVDPGAFCLISAAS